MKKAAAMLIAVLMLLSSSVISAGAITVERDSEQYILRSRTPTAGDINVLMIRVGFADYALDDEEYPADSEATLLSYFDGSEDSVNKFYETSSYGKLRLSCDKVYSYQSSNYRDEYDRDDYYAAYSVEDLMSEAYSALSEDIDPDRYDSDGDGYLDFVCFDFSGPMGSWGTSWWPHVNCAEDLEFGDKRVHAYSFLRGEADTFIHEFGHILGAADYYATDGSSRNSIMTYDMMSIDSGDHDGFTKWSYGWLEDDEIVFADKASGDMTVHLKPIESPAGGKKIAVVAPEIDRASGFLGEYFLVEYDSGEGNNAGVFDEYSIEPGFRVFHISAGCDFYDDDIYIDYANDNVSLRNNLIHNVKNEFGDPSFWYSTDMLYREGDSLTPQGYPNTGLSSGNQYNGRYTGISFTDFVTGEDPSFRVSFSDDPAPEVQVSFTLDNEQPGLDFVTNVTADAPITRRLIMNYREEQMYAPYLIDGEGEKLSLYMEPTQDPFTYSLSYRNNSPSLRPNTKYTLVIPQGTFKAGYDRDVPEFRHEVTTSDFLALSVISTTADTDMEYRKSNIFTVTDSAYGVIRVPAHTSAGRSVFTEYNLDGEEISSLEFDCPDLGEPDVFLYSCRAMRLHDGNFALLVGDLGMTYFVKIDRQGRILSDVYTVSSEQVYDYTYSLMNTTFDLYGNGLCKLLVTEDLDAALLTVDFESEPTLTPVETRYFYYSLDSETYVEEHCYDELNHVKVFGASGDMISDIAFEHGFLCAFEENGNITVIKYLTDWDTYETTYYADVYSKSGELIESRDITSAAEHIGEFGIFSRCHVARDGYILETEQRDRSKCVVAYDKDWNWLGSFTFDATTNHTLVDNCGIVVKTQYDIENGAVEVVSRFNIGEYEIVERPSAAALLGDTDGDGEVTILDATYIQRKLAGLSVPSDFSEAAADTDGDGELSILDATYIQRWLASLPSNDSISQPIIS